MSDLWKSAVWNMEYPSERGPLLLANLVACLCWGEAAGLPQKTVSLVTGRFMVIHGSKQHGQQRKSVWYIIGQVHSSLKSTWLERRKKLLMIHFGKIPPRSLSKISPLAMLSKKPSAIATQLLAPTSARSQLVFFQSLGLPETYKLQENVSFRTYSFSVPNKSQLALFQDQLAHQAKLQWQSGGPGLLIYNPNLFVPWPGFWPYLTWISLTSHPTNHQEQNRLKDSPFLLAEIVAAMAYPKVSAGSKSLGSSSDSSTSRGAGWKEAGPWSKTSRDESLGPSPEASFQLKSWQVEANSCRFGRLILRCSDPSHTSMPAMPFLKTLVEMKDFATLGSGLHPKSSNEQKENEKMCENYIKN